MSARKLMWYTIHLGRCMVLTLCHLPCMVRCSFSFSHQVHGAHINCNLQSGHRCFFLVMCLIVKWTIFFSLLSCAI
uniref:Uncharacterized protein n=1 Tax=Arundo donax TaxID=35708 RepID=A0A0A9HJS1_ARUDO